MSADLRTRIADLLDDFGLRGLMVREQAADAILELVRADEVTP